jgi:predicted P-loop ATPase
MQAVLAAAEDGRFHPVREYFAKLKWDGTPRLATWLATYCGASENQYTQLAGVKFLIGAVARVMKPGCKMDNVLILEGEQGRWKSTALATLAGIEWFGDTPFAIGDKDSFLVTRGNLIYELAELDGFSRAESSRAKAYFSSRYDTFVPKYVAWAIKVPRQLVFAGTVNHGTYLRDTTGNRRYWPVKIERADIESLARDRDQLWAEAVHRFNAGEQWWVVESERELFSLEQELRYVGDAYEDLIREWALGKEAFTMATGAGRLPAPRKIEVDTSRADASRRGVGDPRLREKGPRLDGEATVRVRVARARAGRGGLMNSAPTPHLLRTRYGMRKSLTGKGRTQAFRTSAPRVHVRGTRTRARRAHTRLSGADR